MWLLGNKVVARPPMLEATPEDTPARAARAHEGPDGGIGVTRRD